jgi:hypothetical protein
MDFKARANTTDHRGIEKADLMRCCRGKKIVRPSLFFLFFRFLT